MNGEERRHIDDRVHAEGVSLREYFEVFLNERDRRYAEKDADRVKELDQRFEQREKALALQAGEYERRLAILNHAHEEARRVQSSFVSVEKFEDYLKTEKVARDLALERINEKLEDYITRAETRVHEIDAALATQRTAQTEARRYAEQAAQTAKDHAQAEAEKARVFATAQASRTNRNIVVGGIGVTALIGFLQLVAPHIR